MMATIEKLVCFLTNSKRRGQTMPCKASWGSTRVDQEVEKGGKTWARLYCGFCGVKWARPGKQV